MCDCWETRPRNRTEPLLPSQDSSSSFCSFVSSQLGQLMWDGLSSASSAELRVWNDGMEPGGGGA